MKSKRCFSKCRKLTREECSNKPTFCQFTRGKRNYCRLRNSYLLDKNCNITKKKQKNKNTKNTKKNASTKIKEFMIKTGDKRRSLFLKSICADSGVCVAFGMEINKINKFFDNFSNFEYVVSPVKKIGAVSHNGFVKEIKYEREGYDAYAVLKSSTKEDSDNLMYEYEVGQYINKQNKIFPCFLETYGVFLYKDDASWKHAKDNITIVPNVLKNSLRMLDKIYYSVACLKSKYIAIMVQHIKNATTFNDFYENAILRSKSVPRFNWDKLISIYNHEIVCILYQIYMPLASLINEFTHYDLHPSNVLLYEPVKKSCITYNYHLISGKIVTFKSKYIAKIIDYGRCYYDDNQNSSLKTYKKICRTRECEPDCGEEDGLTILAPEDPPGSFHYISSQVRNASHDLRFAKNVSVPAVKSYLNEILEKIVYNSEYGTKENMKSGLPNKINNVVDMCDALEKLINTPTYKIDNDSYFSAQTNIGDFHIYQDRRPMTFTKK